MTTIQEIEQHNRECKFEDIRYLPPVQCVPWCTWADGHPEAMFAADQYCATDILFVDLSEPVSADARNAGEAIVPEQLHVYGRTVRTKDGTPDRIALTVSVGGRHAPEMTPGEARQLIEAMQLILGQVSA